MSVDILSLATATPLCSVALHRGGMVVEYEEEPKPLAHSSVLVPMMGRVLQRAGCKPATLAAVAVTAGPGSYTGLRVGAAVAKALCYAAELPLLALDTLQTLALPGLPPGAIQVALLDARQGRAYMRVMDSTGSTLRESRLCLITPALFEPWLGKGPLYFMGEGAEKYAQQLPTGRDIHLIPGVSPHARAMGTLAYTLWEQRAWVDTTAFEPAYLPPPERS